MERLDKIIVSQTEYSRKDVKKLVAMNKVTVNGEIVKKSDIKIDFNVDKIKVNEKEIAIKENVYIILNKPQGYISATEDRNMKTVLDLIDEKYLHRELFPAGRLDKDTTGLMLITDDGKFAHNILSPKKHIQKVYEVTIDIPCTEEMINSFKKGIKLNDGICKSADMKIVNNNTAIVTLTEGRYHQIKRMFGCFGAKVVKLNRIAMGNLYLPKNLKLGESREITKEEMESLLKK